MARTRLVFTLFRQFGTYLGFFDIEGYITLLCTCKQDIKARHVLAFLHLFLNLVQIKLITLKIVQHEPRKKTTTKNGCLG